jgi:hypothetical protein
MIEDLIVGNTLIQHVLDEDWISLWGIIIAHFLLTFSTVLLIAIGGFRYLSQAGSKMRFTTPLLVLYGFVSFIFGPLYYFQNDPWLSYDLVFVLINSLSVVYLLLLLLFTDLILSCNGKRVRLFYFFMAWMSWTLFLLMLYWQQDSFEMEFYALMFLLLVLCVFISYDHFMDIWRFLGGKGCTGDERAINLDDGFGLHRIYLVEFILSLSASIVMVLFILFYNIDLFVYDHEIVPIYLAAPIVFIALLLPYTWFIVLVRRRMGIAAGRYTPEDPAKGRLKVKGTTHLKMVLYEQMDRLHIGSVRSMDRWYTRIIALMLLCFGLYILPLSLDTSTYFASWDLNLDFALTAAFLCLPLFFYPLVVLGAAYGGFRNYRHSIVLSFLLIIVWMLYLGGPMGVFTLDEWEEFTYLDITQGWTMFLFLPVIAPFLLPIKDRFFDTRRIVLICLSVSLSIIGGAICYHLFNSDRIGSFDRDTLSHLLYIIPLVLALAVVLSGYVDAEKDRSWGGLISAIKRRGGSFLRNGTFIVVLFLVVPLGYNNGRSYDDWHDYSYSESFPEGQDRILVTTVLSQPLQDYVHTDLYGRDHILDPNVITMETIDDHREWVQNARRGNRWGNYWSEVEITVTHGVNKTIGFSPNDSSPIEIISQIIDNISAQTDRWGWGGSCFFLDPSLGHYGTNESGPWGTGTERNMTVPLDDIILVHVQMHYGIGTAPLAGYGGSSEEYIGVKGTEVVFLICSRSNWIS